MRKVRKLIAVMAAVMVAITAAAFLSGCENRTGESAEKHLVLWNAQTGEKITEYPMDDGETFSIEFIHSVNKSPVRDVYEIRDGEIWNIQCIYYGFGAGVEEIILDGETLTYGENGEMIISDINHRLDNMVVVVGTISDHVLRFGDSDTEVSLRDLCGRSTKVHFTYE